MRDRPTAICGWMLSSLRGKTAGITGTIIWFAAGEFADPDLGLGPRLLVVLGDDLKAGLTDAVNVRLTDPPDVLGALPPEIERQVVEFVAKNRLALLSHWNGEIDTMETLDLLVRVGPTAADARSPQPSPRRRRAK